QPPLSACLRCSAGQKLLQASVWRSVANRKEAAAFGAPQPAWAAASLQFVVYLLSCVRESRSLNVLLLFQRTKQSTSSVEEVHLKPSMLGRALANKLCHPSPAISRPIGSMEFQYQATIHVICSKRA